METISISDENSPEASGSASKFQGVAGGDSGSQRSEPLETAHSNANNTLSITEFMRYEILRGCWLTLREESYSAADHKCLKTFLHDHPDLSPNEIGYEGMAPLHIAVVHGMVDCAELLLSRGASMEIRTATESGELAGLDPLELFSKIRAESSGSSIGNLDPTRYYSWRTQWYMYEVFEFNTIVEDDSYGTINTLGKADGAVYASKSWNLQKAQKSFDLDMRKPFWVNVTATNGVILAKIARSVEKYFQSRESNSSIYIPDTFRRWRRLPSASSVSPGDPLLEAQRPWYKSQLQPNGWKYTIIAFPCLFLRTEAYHKEIRNRVKRMSELFPLSLSPDFEQFNQIHMERTLDEAYYPGLGHEALQQRNKDQVVRREFQEQDLILTVPQLWLWRLDNVVVSAFACLEGFESVDRYFRTNLNADIIDIPDCRMADLIAEQAKAFNHEFRIGDDRIPPVLNIFEGAVVSILSDVDAYMREQSSSGLDIDSEGRFVHRISDLRSELAMIQSILDQQHEVLMLFFEDPFPDPSTENLDCKVTLRETLTLVENARRRTEKIDQDAQRIEQVIQDKLNLKRTAASIEIANASIKEARETKLLSIIVLGFTIITLIFTPISFLATLFALDIDTFSSLKYTTNSMPSAVFSGKKMAGIFVGVEVLTFILTGVLTVGAAYFLFRNLDGWMSLVSRAQAAKELERQSKKSAPGAAENADVNKDSEEAVSQLRTGLAPRDSDERPEVEKKQKQGSMTGQLFSTRFRKGKKKVDGIGEAEAGDYGRTTMAWPSPRN